VSLLAVDLVLDPEVAARTVRALAAQETQTAALIAALGVGCYTATGVADPTGGPAGPSREGSTAGASGAWSAAASRILAGSWSASTVSRPTVATPTRKVAPELRARSKARR
jgi:hypothetical protein